MKKLVIMSLTLILVSAFSTAEAQKISKQEKKALKKEIKSYKKSPEKWAKLKDRQKKQVKELNDEIEALKAKLAAEKAEKEETAAKLLALQKQYNELKSNPPIVVPNKSADLPSGTVYQVQMGYFQYLDLMSFNSNVKSVKAEDVDGAKRYVIGHFYDMSAALQFSNDIKKLGIEDAFVTQYTNGVRNMSFDALEALKDL